MGPPGAIAERQQAQEQRSEQQQRQQPQRQLNKLFSSYATTIFTVMSKLAAEYGAVNLGQGFPDEEGPAEMKAVAQEALFQYHNQYAPMMGVPELRQAVAQHSERYQGIPVRWEEETLITVGATEAIAACCMGLLNPGDEVVIFDPMYDSYVGMCLHCGATIKPVQLQLPDFSISREALERAFSAKSKILLLNTPHNPTGKVFTREELQLIADLCIRHDVIVVCDEVYEHLAFEAHPHVSIRSLPGMAERSLRMGSAGKTFSFTAWKIGWVTGPAHLLEPVSKAHQFLVFTVCSSLQRAVAYGLNEHAQYFTTLGKKLQKKRQWLEPKLSALGFRVLPAQGTYFLVADAQDLMQDGENDDQFCRRLTAEAQVTAIPISALYYSKSCPQTLVRFCFCKFEEQLRSGVERLEQYLKPVKAK